MLGAVALASSPASAHHMGGFGMGGYHHTAYRQHFFYARHRLVFRHPIFIRRHFALIGTPIWLDGGCWRVHHVWTYWGWRWRRGVGVRLRLSRFDAALPEAVRPAACRRILIPVIFSN
jgi:hypothetical protein